MRPKLSVTPVWCAYWPVRMLARDGPHIEVVTCASVKVTPWSASSLWAFFITAVPSERSSSLRITTTFSGWPVPRLVRCAGLAAAAPTTPKTSSDAAVAQIHTTLRTSAQTSGTC